MSVASDTPRVVYTPSVPDVFYDIPFQFDDDAEISVWLNYSLMLLGTDYTLVGAGLTGTGVIAANGRGVTFISDEAIDAIALEQTDGLTVARFTQQYRDTAFENGSPLYAGTLEQQFDLLCLQVQDLQRDVDRTVRVQPQHRPTPHVMDPLDNFVDKAGYMLVVNEDEDAVVLANPTEVIEGAFIHCPDAHGDDQRIMRFDGDNSCLADNSAVRLADNGALTNVPSISGEYVDPTAIDAWNVGEFYIAGDSIVKVTENGYTYVFQCGQNHLSDVNNNPLYELISGEWVRWRPYTEVLDVWSEGVGVSAVRFRPDSFTSPHRAWLVAPAILQDSYKLVIPTDPTTAAVGQALVITEITPDAINGDVIETEFADLPGGGDVGLGDPYQVLVTDAAGTATEWVDRPYDPIAFRPGKPAGSEVLWYGRFARAVFVPDDFAGAYVSALDGATDAVVLTVWISTGLASFSNAGSFTFAAAGNGSPQEATKSTTTPGIAIAKGDRMKITMQAGSDDTLSDVQICIPVQLQVV